LNQQGCFGFSVPSSYGFKPSTKSRLIDCVSAAATAIFCFSAFTWVLRFDIANLFNSSIPLGGDGIGNAYYIKLVTEQTLLNGLNPIDSAHIGWPYGHNLAYFPNGNYIELLILKFIYLITRIHDPATLFKVLGLLKIVPVAIAAWWFGRTLRLSRLASITLAFCFSLSTYNVIRAFGHVFLGNTWPVPVILGVIVASWRLSEQAAYMSSTHKREIVKWSLYLFLCGLSSFYYASFGLILGSAVVILIVASRVRWMRFDLPSSLRMRSRSVVERLHYVLVPLAALLAGFLLQVVPFALEQRDDPPIVSTASRSWTEAILYSGTPETLIYDLNAFLLRAVSRPDVLAFLEGRAPWEARQVGAIAGATACLLVASWAMRILGLTQSRKRERESGLSRSDNARVRILLLFGISMYFVGPVSFGLSRTFMPFIRAWGRMAPFLTLLLVTLLLMALRRVRQRELQFPVCFVLVFIQLLEVNAYRQTFPDGKIVAAVAAEARQLRQMTVSELATKWPQNCAIAQLPIYPYPEYNPPDDSNGDYGLLDLPLVDEYGFRWSYGAVKNTSASRHYAPFVAQQPPFARISLHQQIQYWAALRPCGIVIDRTYLYQPEWSELETVIESFGVVCATELKGEQYNGAPRFVMLNLSNTGCIPRIGSLTSELVKAASSNEVFWQPTTVGIKKFERYWGMIGVGTPHQLMYSVRGGRESLNVRLTVLVVNPDTPAAGLPVNVCITDVKSQCQAIVTDGAGIADIPFTLRSSRDRHEILTVLVSADDGQAREWGVIIRPSKVGNSE
jgi:hypothetical protein